MLPPAPGLLSTMMVAFMSLAIAPLSWRERMSALPPAAYGQIQVITLLGYLSCAIALTGRMAAAPAAWMNVRRFIAPPWSSTL